MGGPETVKEVDERDATPIAGSVGDQGEIMRLLRVVRAEEDAPGGAAGHDVLMVAEDRQSLRGQSACAHMQGERKQFARDLVEIRDHQEQSLRSREGGRQGAGQEAAVNRARHPAFALKLNHARDLPPEIGLTGGRPLVARFRHR